MVATSSLPPVSLRQLRCFAASVELGSLGRAANSIGLSQPAASEAIRLLEQSLGTPLLLRHTGGSTPTPSGETLALRAGRLLARLEAALSAAAPGARTPLASLRMVQLRAHLGVARHGSFAAAAADLGVSLPAVQRAARGLEALLRVPLYRSLPSGRAVNPVGAELARQISLALAELAQARAEIAPRAPSTITLGILPLMPKLFLARVVARTRRAASAPAITVRENSAAALVEQLRWGGIDAILGALPVTGLPPDFAVSPLFADPWVIAARRGHPVSTGADLGALAACAWVAPTPDLPRRAAIEAFFATLPYRPQVWLETDSLGIMLAVLGETDCLTLLARSQLALDGVAALTELRAGPIGESRAVALAQRADWLPTPGQRMLLDTVAETAREVAPDPLD
jgi:LysR family transcriptional regulator of gallate degradation